MLSQAFLWVGALAGVALFGEMPDLSASTGITLSTFCHGAAFGGGSLHGIGLRVAMWS